MGWLQAERAGRWVAPIVRPISPDQLVNDVGMAWPWPYTAAQIQKIGEMVPADRRSDCERGVVTIARMSVCGRYAQQMTPGGSRNTNVKAEVKRALGARAALLSALEGLSAESHEYLQDRNHQWSEMFVDILKSMYRFEGANLPLTDAPGVAKGPPERNGLVWAAHQIDLCWTGAHRGFRPKNGFPAFREAALQPLFGKYESKTLESRLPKWRAARAKPPTIPEE